MGDLQTVDFAISYAGEDEAVAREIDRRLTELGFSVFFAARSRAALVGADGEQLFERLFSNAKQVVVFISESYKKKEWTRYEWDVIRKRENINRFIPVRIDDALMLGLPSSIIYLSFTGENYQEIVETCVRRLLSYEQAQGCQRPTEYERILEALQQDSQGALAQAYQLVRDQRTRSPLGDCDVPDIGTPCYEVVEKEWYDFSVIRRLSLKVLLPRSASRECVRSNLIHCAATHFNTYKPDAVMVFGYFDEGESTDIDSVFTAGRAVFAPFGKWEKAQDGMAYNIPTSEFKFSVDFA